MLLRAANYRYTQYNNICYCSINIVLALTVNIIVLSILCSWQPTITYVIGCITFFSVYIQKSLYRVLREIFSDCILIYFIVKLFQAVLLRNKP